MSDVEEAKHHGYSRADFASEMEELEKIYHELGCEHCKYEDYNSPVCEAIFEGACRGSTTKCQHFTKEEQK